MKTKTIAMALAVAVLAAASASAGHKAAELKWRRLSDKYHNEVFTDPDAAADTFVDMVDAVSTWGSARENYSNDHANEDDPLPIATTPESDSEMGGGRGRSCGRRNWNCPDIGGDR